MSQIGASYATRFPGRPHPVIASQRVGANASRERAPDDRLRGVSSTPRLLDFIATAETVIASEAKQSISPRKERVDCFVALLLAMTVTIFGHPATGLWIRFSNSPPYADTASRSRRAFSREFCVNFAPS